MSGTEPMDMDALLDEELAAGREEVKKDEPDRGDELTTEDGEKAGEKEVTVEEELDVDALGEIAGEEKPAGIPVGRVGELARERSLAVSISDSIIDGVVDPAAVKALGGTVAVAKMINSGDIAMEDLSSVEKVAPKKETVEPVDVKGEWKKYYEAMEDGKDDVAEEIMAGIDAEQQRLISETARTIVDETLSKRDEKSRMKSQRQETVEANDTATRVFSDYPEIDENSAEYDPIAFSMFSSAINAYRNDGNNLNDAIILAEKRIYKPSEKGDADRLSQRDIDARKRNAGANNAQPPRAERGSGAKDSSSIKLAEMTPEEIAKLPEKVKAKLRGDIVE